VAGTCGYLSVRSPETDLIGRARRLESATVGAMSQRDDRYGREDLPSTTAEFRATPDASASTAQFKAFAAGQAVNDEELDSPTAWPEQPWAGRPPGTRKTRVLVIVGVLVLMAIIIGSALLLGGNTGSGF
jgi:hypothetical protein